MIEYNVVSRQDMAEQEYKELLDIIQSAVKVSLHRVEMYCSQVWSKPVDS